MQFIRRISAGDLTMYVARNIQIPLISTITYLSTLMSYLIKMRFYTFKLRKLQTHGRHKFTSSDFSDRCSFDGLQEGACRPPATLGCTYSSCSPNSLQERKSLSREFWEAKIKMEEEI